MLISKIEELIRGIEKRKGRKGGIIKKGFVKRERRIMNVERNKGRLERRKKIMVIKWMEEIKMKEGRVKEWKRDSEDWKKREIEKRMRKEIGIGLKSKKIR